MRALEPIRVEHLFAPLEAKLIELLQSLTDDEWHQRALPQWTVKDISAHLLDGSLRRLSIGRDGFFGEQFSGSTYAELVGFLNGLNSDWVKAFKRISPPVLISLLKQSSRELSDFFQTLDPEGTAPFPVSWAGETTSKNWFDIAREYTERWHHQQQIREAVNRPGIMDRQLYHPVLDTFMRVLPHAYRDVDADRGAALKVTITGDAGGEWYLRRSDAWVLCKEDPGDVRARVEIPEEIAWRLFTKGLDDAQKAKLKFEGDARLSAQLMNSVAVMA